MTFPTTGKTDEQIFNELSAMRENDADYAGGKTWSLVYHVSEEHADFLASVHKKFASTNLLNPLAFQSLKEMERQVVNHTASLLNGPDTTVGTITSGGTESILLAVKAAKERHGFVLRGKPELVVPETIHTAFIKAADYFGLKVRRAKVDKNFRADVGHIKKLTNRNTALIAASAPQYAHGVVDPITEIASFAQKKKIPFHVDACFGGFILPWFEALGEEIPLWDFRVSGVTSISADIHKFGYAAKGASVLLYRDMSYLKHQFFIDPDFPGGIYASPTILGTRPGGPVAAAWAVLQKLGEEGYMELAKTALETRNSLRDGIAAIDGLKILGSQHGPVVTYASDHPDVDIYAVADQLMARGWSVDRQQTPASIHCTVNANNAKVLDEYLADITEAVAEVKAHPELKREGEAAMYGMMARVPLRGAVKMGVRNVMEAMHAPEKFDGVSSASDDDPMMKIGTAVFDAVDFVKKKIAS